MQATWTSRIWQGIAALGLWLSLMAGPAQAAENLPLKFQRYGLEQGLSQSVVTQIVQDSGGFLWLGTQDGLNRFDGYGFRHYRHGHDQPDSLAANFVSALLADSQGRLWVGTELGLDRFLPEQGRFQHETLLPPGQAGDEGLRVSALWEDRQGRLWVGTGNGLFLREDSGVYTRHAFDAQNPESLSDNRINTLAEDGLGGLWIGTEEGLNRRDAASGKIQRFHRDPSDPNSLSDDRVLALHWTANGQLWVGTVNGLNRFRPGQQDFLRYFSGASPRDLPSNRVQALSSDAEGRLWIGTERGLTLRTEPGGGFQTLYREPQDPQGLPGDDITSFFTDRTGLLWLGTYGAGAAAWNPESARFAHYLSGRDGGPPRGSNRVEAVSQDRLGRLWMGTMDEGAFRLDRVRRELKHFRHEPGKNGGLAHPRVSAIVEDRRGRMWFATHGGGLNRLDPGEERFHHWQHKPRDAQSLSDDRLLSLLEDRGGQLWIGSESGLERYLEASEGFERLGDSLPVKFRNIDRRVNTLLDTSDGSLWLGGDGGLLRRRENGGFDLYQSQPHEPGSLSHTAVLSLFEDAQSRLWIGTAAGLNRVDGQGDSLRFLRLGEAPILQNGVIYAIAGDREGLLWLSTNQGLWRFSPESGRIDQFGLRDGLQADEFSTASQYTAPDGELFFGGINGLSGFRPEAIVTGRKPPRVLFSELREYRPDGSRSSDLGGVPEIAIPAAARTFTISFAAADFVHPGGNRFQYRMTQGAKGEWISLEHQRELSFTDLSRGDYSLEVRASSRDGQWADEGRILNVRVAGPWWRSSRAWLGSLLAGACLGLMGARIWKRQQVRSRQRRQMEAKALQESLALHEHELKALHLHILSLEQNLQERIDENQALTSQLYELSMLDSLTELHNRRYISLNRERLWPSDVVRGHGLILLDIDGFIQLNRARGQAMGDRVLAQAATLLKNLCPENACIVRWGGDEFLILVANAGVEATEALAESLRVGFAQHEFLLGGEERMSLSCSLGACCHAFLPGAAEQGFEQALNLAERAMYAAKASSRNAWVLVGPGREAPARSLTGELSMTELLERGWIRVVSSLPKGFAIRWLN